MAANETRQPRSGSGSSPCTSCIGVTYFHHSYLKEGRAPRCFGLKRTVHISKDMAETLRSDYDKGVSVAGDVLDEMWCLGISRKGDPKSNVPHCGPGLRILFVRRKMAEYARIKAIQQLREQQQQQQGQQQPQQGHGPPGPQLSGIIRPHEKQVDPAAVVMPRRLPAVPRPAATPPDAPLPDDRTLLEKATDRVQRHLGAQAAVIHRMVGRARTMTQPLFWVRRDAPALAVIENLTTLPQELYAKRVSTIVPDWANSTKRFVASMSTWFVDPPPPEDGNP